MRSAFAKFHPAVLFSYYIGVMVLAMTLLHPFILLSMVLLLSLLNYIHGTTMKPFLLSSFVLAVFIAVMNPLFTHRGSTILFYVQDNPVTLEAITYGYTMALSFLAVSFAFVSYQAIVSSHKFLYLFSRVSPKVALLTMIAIRFVPLFMRRLGQIQLVHKHKGVGIKAKASQGMKLLSVLLVCSLEEALQTADSMSARGFGTTKRSTYIRYRMSNRDYGLFAVLLGLFLGAVILASQGIGVLVIYPKLPSLMLRGMGILSYMLCMLYVSIPLVIEGREWLWWRMQK
ncbi:energy-coupling factor transporter transmembrane component T [Ectobacillus antri]|jgi:energy-coupling factor transport system permease protein|uniref:Energy-coupling factor transporter transmembrane component T n=1 Tax=Ectobacillus antri TaxID=2486280 RepID=A0ABT6H4W4_9BACI|nr:energy-coupling factor transporter transmembrane component T [Ectobacillus antri]MDG4656988.1 energy-coupling factor transporter transmembrane component T [Ectobacillus antri]MDG5754090.1 energy-coupling factor transporter transmembrane component T [Ectobacillus antri]